MQEDAATYQYQYIYMRHQQHISTIKPAVIRDLLPDCQVPWQSVFANSQQKERNNLSNPVYVGDTAGDASAAREAEIDFIYAEYGFGEVEPSLYVGVIDSFKELKDILL